METTSPTFRSAAAATSRPARWWIGTLAGAFLGCVLLVAVWAKALDPAGFAEQIQTEGLDSLLPSGVVALLALALEAGLGLALVLGLRRLWVLLPAALLVTFFLGLSGRAWWLSAHGLRDEAAGCGCFGNLVQRTPAEAFWQDLLLLLPPLLLSFVGRDRHGRTLPPLRTVTAAAGALAVTAFAWKAPELPLDDLATRLRPGVAIGGLCAGADEQRTCLDFVLPELRQGRHLVVLAKLDDPRLASAVPALNAFAGRTDHPTVWLLVAATPEQQRAFFWQWGPVFQVREAPPPLLRPLYRRLPRAFLVKDGRVTRTFSGLPPLPELAASSQKRFSERSST